MSDSLASRPKLEQQIRGQVSVKTFLVDFLLLASAALVFALSFPSFLSDWGFGALGFFALLPLPVVLRRNGYGGVALLGILYGYGSYAIFNYWLAKFHPLAHIIVPVIYGAYFLVLFPLLKAADDLFPKHGYLVQVVVWLAYEFLRTVGFLGYSYGILGYTQYQFPAIARVASITGVFGVSALVVFPSWFLGRMLLEAYEAPGLAGFRGLLSGCADFLLRRRLVVAGYLICFLGAVIFGVSVHIDYSESRSWRVAMIQQNVDPWKGGTRAFRKSLDIHTRLSLEAEQQDPDIVIWSETAFVPSIFWHTRFRTDQDRYLLVRELTEFLDGREIPYVIGNGDGQLEDPGLAPVLPDGSWNRLDYNAVLLYQDGEIDDTYRKLHLVPFTESFPFEEQLPGLYRWLEEADTHFWEAGRDYTVFETDGIRFSTPICYEDTFGYLSRGFVRSGAEVIVNLTNDSWSASVPAMMQHMAMSVFRAVENRRTMVRSTNGGITCTIDPNGRITSMIEPFVEGYLVADVPVYAGKTTWYTRFGEWFGIGATIAGALLLAGAAVGRLVRRRSSIDKHTESE